MTEFEPWPKIPRLRREITITEKIDGTNAQICIDDLQPTYINHDRAPAWTPYELSQACIVGDHIIWAGSRTRWITPGKDTDNFGFAAWVWENADELVKLGTGRHYGEWWGQGIQRRYDLDEKRFSLFNTARPADTLPDCVSQVPLLCCIAASMMGTPCRTVLTNFVLLALALPHYS
jgi:hypothetical protein